MLFFRQARQIRHGTHLTSDKVAAEGEMCAPMFRRSMLQSSAFRAGAQSGPEHLATPR